MASKKRQTAGGCYAVKPPFEGESYQITYPIISARIKPQNISPFNRLLRDDSLCKVSENSFPDFTHFIAAQAGTDGLLNGGEAVHLPLMRAPALVFSCCKSISTLCFRGSKSYLVIISMLFVQLLCLLVQRI